MITSYSEILSYNARSAFQRTIVDHLLSLLSKVHLANLHELSFIDTDKDKLLLSMVHANDIETVVTINVFIDHCSVWCSECNIKFFDEAEADILEALFAGNYYSNETYYNKKKIVSEIFFVNNLYDGCKTPYSFFFKIYLLLFKRKLIVNTTHYCSFFN